MRKEPRARFAEGVVLPKDERFRNFKFQYNRIGTIQELENIVQTDKEHPEWEALITLENLYERLKEIQNDIEAVS
ncbi:MAG: hypothetical protein GWN56_16930 [Nitrosopumilaceae archaeon]|nr:hypothetical protein [Nitrosopumilaceae archaeon]NIV66995.1 hypothetical protein [Nitrosopumilaceae archaeon]